MDVFFSVMLLACIIQRMLSHLQLEPRTQTVLRGETARLTCSTTEPWDVMLWYLNNSSVLTVSFQHGVLGTHPYVKAVDRSTGQRSSWELVLTNAQRSHQGTVACELQTIRRETATLFVQEGGSVAVSGGNRTALRGQQLLFECHAVGWHPAPRLVWQLNSQEVDHNGEHNISSEVSKDGLYNVTSTYSVTAAKSSHVECLAWVSALPVPLASRVRLTVVAEVLAEAEDCTILLALAASMSTLFVLLLLCLCVVTCCKRARRAKLNKEDNIRADKSESRRSSPVEATGGKVNMGYTSEGVTEVDHGDLISGDHGPITAVNIQTIPDVASSNIYLHTPSQALVELGRHGAKVTRSVTTV